jgi:AraC-like DNA-binding protein
MIRIDQIRLDRFEGGAAIAAHRHANAYAAIVLEGAYEEACLDGRFACSAGSVVLHPPFHVHADDFGAGDGAVLNLPLPDAEADLAGYRCLPELDGVALARLARRDPRAAAREALDAAGRGEALSPPDWMTHFLARLLDDEPPGPAARACGVSAEHASRACRAWFGLSPVRLRREHRIRRAIGLLREGGGPAEVAALTGFSDQPHLTRTLKSAIGLTPGRLRAA